MRLRNATLLLAGLTACLSRPENQRAKERIFAPHPVEPTPPAQIPIEVDKLATSDAARDHALGMGEDEAAARLGSFRLHGTLSLAFSGPGQSVTLTEDRLVEQSRSDDVHLRLLESSGNGMELVLAKGRLYGRSRYGPYVERESQDELPRLRDEVFGALGSLYRESQRGWSLAPVPAENLGGRSGQCFAVGRGTERPAPHEDAFQGRLDPDSQKHFGFLYARRLVSAGGTVCFDRVTGVPLSAKVKIHWTARAGDAGVAEIEADLTQAVEKAGEAVAVETPAASLPIPHRPRGQAAALERFGFLQRTDGGTLVAAAGPAPAPAAHDDDQDGDEPPPQTAAPKALPPVPILAAPAAPGKPAAPPPKTASKPAKRAAKKAHPRGTKN